jgi:hypothetical protein
VLVVRRAKIAQTYVRLVLQPDQKAFGDARLADARLARE